MLRTVSPRGHQRDQRRSSFLEWTRWTGVDPTWTNERTPSRHSGFYLARKFLWYSDLTRFHAIATRCFGGSSCFQFSLWRASMRSSKEMDTAETFSRPRIEEGSARASHLFEALLLQRVHWWSWSARKDIMTRRLGRVLFSLSLLFSPSECHRYDFSFYIKNYCEIIRGKSEWTRIFRFN